MRRAPEGVDVACSERVPQIGEHRRCLDQERVDELDGEFRPRGLLELRKRGAVDRR
jgi:hypothetical protein